MDARKNKCPWSIIFTASLTIQLKLKMLRITVHSSLPMSKSSLRILMGREMRTVTTGTSNFREWHYKLSLQLSLVLKDDYLLSSWKILPVETRISFFFESGKRFEISAHFQNYHHSQIMHTCRLQVFQWCSIKNTTRLEL